MEERDIYFLLGMFLVVTFLFVAIEFLLPAPSTAAGVNGPWVQGPVTTDAARIPGQRYDPLPDVAGFFSRLDAEWIPPHVTTVAARRSGHGQWVYRGPTKNYGEHCSAALKDRNVPENLLEQACGE